MVSSFGEERQACHLHVGKGRESETSGALGTGQRGVVRALVASPGSVLWPEVGDHFLFPTRCPCVSKVTGIWAPSALVRPLSMGYVCI